MVKQNKTKPNKDRESYSQNVRSDKVLDGKGQLISQRNSMCRINKNIKQEGRLEQQPGLFSKGCYQHSPSI